MNKKDCKAVKCEYLDEKHELCKDTHMLLHNIMGCGIVDNALLQVDEVTNEIMDVIRDEFKLNSNTDKDDEVYSKIHTIIKEA